jgi:hypothetical protein
MTRISIVLVTVALFTGCKKKEEDGAPAGKPTEAKAAAKGGPTKLPKLGLSIDVPGKVDVGDAIMGDGHMLMGAGVGAMTIEVAAKPQTLEEAKSDAELYSPKNQKEETLADGWVLTFDNTGSMGKNYFVTVRRDIDGKTYTCSTTGSDASQAAAVLAACKSLRP